MCVVWCMRHALFNKNNKQRNVVFGVSGCRFVQMSFFVFFLYMCLCQSYRAYAIVCLRKLVLNRDEVTKKNLEKVFDVFNTQLHHEDTYVRREENKRGSRAEREEGGTGERGKVKRSAEKMILVNSARTQMYFFFRTVLFI